MTVGHGDQQPLQNRKEEVGKTMAGWIDSKMQIEQMWYVARSPVRFDSAACDLSPSHTAEGQSCCESRVFSMEKEIMDRIENANTRSSLSHHT